MAQCSTCGTSIVFGGVRDGTRRFCNAGCRKRGVVFQVADQIPEDVVAKYVKDVHEGDCPKCGGPGPVDVHTSHSVWSAMVMTSWKSNPELCCAGCGSKARVNGALMSGLLGWWGFPFGLIITPFQIFRNVAGLISPPDPMTPSPELENLVRTRLAAAHLQRVSQAGSDS